MPAFRDLPERLFVKSVSNPLLSRPMAALADLALPRPVLDRMIDGWVRAYRVDTSEIAEPLHSFRTFNDFFTRALRPGARPLAAGPGVVLSPCDSRLASIGVVSRDSRIEQVKGRSYTVEALLGGGAEDAADFQSGVHATLYLSPAMYHRVHSPVTGRIVSWRYVPGRLFPVNALAVKHVDGLFTVNERVCVRIETEEFGPVAVVLVGAANVGRISLTCAPGLFTNTGGRAGVTRPAEPIPVNRGDELGAFNLGSTVVMVVSDTALVPAAPAGDLVQMGQALWRRG